MPISIEEYLALPDVEEPTELVRGEVVKKQFTYINHGIVCANICLVLGECVKAESLGTGIALHGVITRRNPDSLRTIDVGYYSKRRLPRTLITDKHLPIAPEVLFEVISHDETWQYILQKVTEFIEAGTFIANILDPVAETVHVFQRDRPVQILRDTDELNLTTVIPGFHRPVCELFA